MNGGRERGMVCGSGPAPLRAERGLSWGRSGASRRSLINIQRGAEDREKLPGSMSANAEVIHLIQL